MVKTFGRNSSNTNQINKSDISDFHARITALPSGEFLVEDRGAITPGEDTTNGTFINGYRVLQATVSQKDEVRFSIDTLIDLNEVFGLNKSIRPVKTDPKDFTMEFTELKEVYDKYKKSRRSVISNTTLKANLVRITFMLLPPVMISGIQYFGSASPEQINGYLHYSVVGSALGILLASYISPTEKLEDLDDNFRVQYVCPNPECHLPLGNIPWLNYQKQSKCFRCGAKYKTDKV